MRHVRIVAAILLALPVGCARPAARQPTQPAANGAAPAAAAPDKAPASVAGLAGRACPAPLASPFTVVPQGGIGGTAEMQYSKDGRIAAAKPSALEIQIWNVATASKVAVVTPGTAISSWALRPDGRVVAVVSEGRLTFVDPMSRGGPLKVNLPANVERVDWRADGKGVFATRAQETSVVDIAGNVTATIAAVSSPGAISPDGRFLFSRDGAMWDVATNQSKWKSAAPSVSVAFSDDGQFIALAASQSITVYESASGNKKWEVTTKGGIGSEVAISPDGQSVAAYDNGESTDRGLDNRGMALWNKGKRAKLWQSAEAAPSTRATFSPDAKTVGFIATGNATEVKLADARTGARAKQTPKNSGEVRPEPPRWSADSRTLLQPSTVGLLVLDLVKGDRKVIGKSIESTSAGPVYHDAVWSPDDGAILIVADHSGRSIATIVDLKTGTPRETLDGRTGSPAPKRFRNAEWNATTGLIAIDRNDGVAIWDGKTKQPARVVDGGDESLERQIAFSPQGHMLATLVSPNKEVRLWDPKTGAKLRALNVPGSGVGEDGTPDVGIIEAMAFSADGARIALKAMLTSGVEQSTHIAIYDTATGTLVRTLHSQRHYAYGPNGRAALYFTPQGKGIVSVDASGRVELWNTANDDPPTPLLEKPTPGPSTLADAGNLLLMGTPTLDVWDLRTRTLTRELRGEGSTVIGTRMAKGVGAIALTRVDRVDLHRLTDRASLTVRIAPSPAATPSVIIVADNGTFTGPNGAAAANAAAGPLRVRDGAEPDVRSLRPNEITTLYRPTLALDFVAGCPVSAP